MAKKSSNKKTESNPYLISGKEFERQQAEKTKQNSPWLMSNTKYERYMAGNPYQRQAKQYTDDAGMNVIDALMSRLKQQNVERQQQQEAANKAYEEKLQQYNYVDKVLRGDVDLGSWGSELTEDYKSAVSIGNAKIFRAGRNEMIAGKVFDNDKDMTLWSPEKRKSAREEYILESGKQQEEIDRLSKLIEEKEKPAQFSLWETAMKASSPDGFIPRSANNKEELAVDMALGDDEYSELVKQKKTAEEKLKIAKDNIDKIDKLDKEEADYRQLMEGREKGDTKYHSELNIASDLGTMGTYIDISRPVDIVYAVTNGALYNDEMDINNGRYTESLMMLQEERDVFNSLYNAGKKNEAWSFYQGLLPYLNQAKSSFEKLSMEQSARRFPILSSAATAMATVVQPVEFAKNLPGIFEAWITGKNNEQSDPFSNSYTATRLKTTVRNQITNDLGDWGWVYGGVMSGVDSAINVAIAKGIGLPENLLQYGTLGLFFTQAFETSLQNTMAQGNDSFGYDVIEAFIDSAIETATEIWSVENWLAEPTNLLRYVGKIAISEPSEEIVGAIIEPYVKRLIGHKDEYTERARQILIDGGYTDSNGDWIEVKDMDAATRQAMREWNHNIRMAAQEALVSVGPSVVYGGGQIALQNRNIGQALNGNAEDIQKLAQSAAAMGEGTDSAKGASKILKQLEAKGKAKNSTLGQTAQDILRESNEKIGESAKEQTQSAIEKMLQDKGVEAEEAKNLAPMIKKALELGGIEKLSKKERDAIHANEAAVNTLYQFRFNQQLQQDVVKAAEGQEQNASAAKTAVSELLKKNIKRGASIVKQATDKEVQLAEENGSQRIKGNREAIIYDQKTGNGSFVKIDGITTKKKSGRWQLSVNITTADGQKMSVAPSDLHVTDYKASQIITAATNMPELYSDGFTKLLLDSANSDMIGDEKNLDKTLEEITTLRMVAYAGLDTSKLKLTGISEKLAEVIRQQAAHEHEQNQAKWEGKKNRRTDPRITYGNAVFGTEAWTKAIENLDEETKNWMETIAGIAQRAGIDVSFRDMKNDMLYGAEGDIGAERTGIALNIKGYDYIRDEKTKEIKRSDKKHHMLVTFGHELTHWLQRNSRDGYNRLEKFVLQTYVSENSAEDLAKRLRNRMFNEGESIEEALSEIVAESCDQILMDEEVRDHIAKTDGKLFTEIKNFVKDLVERFKKAVLGMEDSQSYYARQMANHMNELRKIWLGAYDEALSGMAAENEDQETGTDARKSELNIDNIKNEEYNDNNEEKEGINDEERRKGSSERIREQVNELLGLGRNWDLSGKEALRLLKGNNQGIIRPGQKGYELFRQALRDSVFVDRKRNPLIWLHGTDKQFSVFDIKELIDTDKPTGSFFTDNPDVANIYAKENVKNKHIYPAGVNSQHNIVLKAAEFRNDIIKHQKALGLIQLIHEFAKQYHISEDIFDYLPGDIYKRYKNLFGREMAYKVFSYFDEYGDIDTVEIEKAIWDDNHTPNNQLIVFDKERIIPASTKFWEENANEIENNSRRWSKAQLDDEYMAVVNMGRYDLAEKMVDKAAKEAGYTIKAYHGTPNGKFTVFDKSKVGTSTDFGKLGRGFYFTSKKQVADYYAGYLNSSTVMPVYLKLTNPFVLDRNYDNMTVRELYDSILGEGGIVDEQRSEELTRWLVDNGYDGIVADGEYMVLDPQNIKSAESVTYDKYGDVIPLSERFNKNNQDIRWSRAIEEEAEEKYGVDLNMDDHTATMFSRASYERSEYYKNPDEMARMLARNVLGSESKANVRKAKKWIRDVTGVAALIGERSELLDYIASSGRSSFKSNPEYGGSIDSSTICAKRLLQTGTIDAIQRAMPDYVMSAEDFLQIRRMMKERGYEVSCGLCFVESSRKNIAKYASQFMREWNSQHPDNQVNMVQINTVLGLEDTRLNNKEVYDAYEKFMNKLAQRKPKLFEMRSEYDNDILKHFKNDSSVKDKNRNGGMRINSFSDFEIVHLIDMMQVIMDMSNVGLAGQAYTKVREFAEALGKTGLKINMSMIAKGVDENGRIIFDEVEGMKWSDVQDLRDRYADNVGTVCVVFTEEQLMAAMADDRIDFIIPFHRSQWNKSNYKDIGLPENTKDFTYWQNERYRTPVYGTKKDGSPKKLRAANYMPNEYWDFTKSGKQNAEAYLEKCYKENKVPKFWKWLDTDGKGRYFLKADGSTDGYWKLLIDFKMYNHITNVGAEQMPVKPEFDMDACERMLKEYKGGHQSFPEALDVVKDFVAEKRKGKKGVKVSQSGQIRLAGNEIDEPDTRMSKYSPESMDVQTWMKAATYSTFQTEDERALWEAYHRMRNSMDLSLKKQLDYRDKIRQLEEAGDKLTPAEKDDLTALRNRLEIEKNKYARQQDELIQITTGEGFASMMYRNNRILKDYIQGKTQDQVRQAVEGMLKLVQQTQEEIRKDTEELKKLSQTQAVKTMKSFMGKSSLSQMATNLRKAYNSTLGKAEIEDRMAEMVLKQASGQDITADTEALARDLVDKVRGYRTDLLDYLQGVKLNIGESMLDEYIAQNRITEEVKRNKNDNDESVMKKARRIALKQLNDSIKGSGVKIISEGENSRFSEQWRELRGNNGALADIDGLNEMDGLNKALDQISDNVKDSLGSEQNKYDFDEVAAMVRASVGNVTTYLSGDADARAQINNLMKQIRELSSKTEKTAEGMEALEKQLDDVILAGQKAKGWTTILQRDVAESIRYYNKTAKVAAQVAKNEVRKKLIETLKSQHTKELLQQQEKYEEMMRNDKKAREMYEANRVLRRQITTVATRLANRMFAETDQKNIPEEAKPLVRQVLEMLSKFDAMSGEEEYSRKATNWNKKQITDIRQRLLKMLAASGPFNADEDLDFLVIKAQDPADNDYTVHDKVVQDLINIETGLLEYRTAEGKGRVSLADRKAALDKAQEAVSEIWDIVKARGEAFINGKRYELAELAKQMDAEMAASKFKGERTGVAGKTFDAMIKAVGYGNLTPEYFFKNLKNGVMKLMHKGFQDAEQRAGLEALAAKIRIAEIAEETGFSTWDGQEKHKVKTRSGEIEMTTEQIMALYATWKRESNQLRPEETAHLLHGGFVLAQPDQTEGIYGRQRNNQRPIRMSKESLDALGSYLTDEQREYVDKIIEYMSSDLAELGNETSMQTFGIKKFTEQFYYPIKSWEGVLSKKSDAGVTNKNDNRSMRQSFTKRVKANASNAIEIGDFTPTAMKHITGMISYNTTGPAVENLNRLLNQQITYGDVEYDDEGEVAEDDRYKKSIEASFQDAYGTNAAKYLRRFMEDVNGGMTRRTEKSLQEKLLTVFRKGAVAGSLSVAAQQPLSYIRAAMKINPVYLARAIAPTHWGKIHDEMLKYSGIAVIKDMGRFDMNQGQSMTDFITPEGMESKARKIGRKAVDATTILPEKMDQMTWGRMWIACKLQTAAENKGMDQTSDEFLQKVAERFNEVMRTTQVYDSMMVKSQNMRSQNYAVKAMTSFMAEPTLTLNVLADAVQNFGSEGGKKNMAKAVTTFVMSAAAQALVKAIMSSGRSPDDKKRLSEQFLTKWHSMFISEVDPLTLIPGYSDIIEVLKNGELADDAWSVFGKLRTVFRTGIKMFAKGEYNHRNFEDTIGQLAQLFSNVPLKNLMRDARAIYNFMDPEAYAQRDYSSAVTKYGIKESFYSADNLIGLVNSYLKDADAGYQSTNGAYYDQLYEAETSGDTEKAQEIRDYLINGKGVKESAIQKGISERINKDDSLSGPEKVQEKLDNGASAKSIKDWITSTYKAQYIAADTNERRKMMNELTKMYKLIGVSGDDAMKIVSGWVKEKKK